MKYAVISDIHGNHPALQAVLEDVRKQGIRHCLFAGDYCISGPWPDECIRTIREIPEKTVIRGNEEKYLENLIGKDPVQWTDGQMQASYWCYQNVRRENLEYLLGLPHKVSLAKLRKNAVACTECGACYEACPMGIKSIFTVREGKNELSIDVTTADCLFCGECIRRCPEDGALFMTLAGKKIYTASRMKFMRDYTTTRGKKAVEDE